jgi:DNA topoisomerase-1
MHDYLKWNIILLYGGGGNLWTTLIHNGPYFPPPYIPHKIPVIINNKEIILDNVSEEYATLYAKYLDTDYINRSNFNKNFWNDFKKVLPKDLNVKLLKDIDFTLIKKYLISEKEKKNDLSKEYKEKIKKEQDSIEEPYKFCIIDGVQQSIGNFKMEPPSIFLGRGNNHPKLGKIKLPRILPEDVTINISKDSKIPEPNLKNHKWGKIINDKSVIWLATWKDIITNKNKYIFTSFDSFFKSKSDEAKFDLAKQLKKKVHKIREDYEKQLIDSNFKNKQLATALYLIDKLALRVGGVKDTKEEADTVGVTSLRVEHITLLENNIIKLDFLGKDSIRYCKKINISEIVFNNLKEMIIDKSKKDEIFHLINASLLNEYLSSFMKGLTAKVWRTYNASYLFQKEIDKIKEHTVSSINQNERLNYLIAQFNIANSAVALLCNHQKSVNTSIENMLDKINIRIKELKQKKIKFLNSKDKVKKIDAQIKSLKLKKETKIKMKNVSLGTSKNNYIDPRIIFAFIKKFEIPPEKIFTATLLKRFEWATNIDKDYKF